MRWLSLSFHKRVTTCVLGVIGLLAASMPLEASFVGNTVSVNYEWPNIGTVLYTGGSKLIPAAGATFSMDGGAVTADVTNSNVAITFVDAWGFSTAPKTFDGIVITDLAADITGISLVSTNITGFVASDLSFNSHDVYVDFPYPPFASLPAGSSVLIDVQFAPEPASVVLLGTGLLGMGLLKRRRAVR